MSRVENLSSVQRNKLLGSLNFPARDARWNDITKANPKTFQWLFGSNGDGHISQPIDTDDMCLREIIKDCQTKICDSFRMWLQSSDSIYWITGKPGAGKSTLMKFLASHPRTMEILTSTQREPTIILRLSLYLIGTTMQFNIKGLVCTLLYQLLLKDFDGSWLNYLFRQFPDLEYKNSESDWSVSALQKVLFRLLEEAMQSRNVFIFLNGLDEIHPSDTQHTLVDLLKEIRSSSPIRICISSRKEPLFEHEYRSIPNLELHNLSGPDVYSYAFDKLLPLATRLADCNSLSKGGSIGLLARQVVEISDGVFLWARIAVQSLQ